MPTNYENDIVQIDWLSAKDNSLKPKFLNKLKDSCMEAQRLNILGFVDILYGNNIQLSTSYKCQQNPCIIFLIMLFFTGCTIKNTSTIKETSNSQIILQDSFLQLVDVSLISAGTELVKGAVAPRETPAMIDLKVRNSGKLVAFVKKVELEIKHIYTLNCKTNEATSYVEPSHIYEMSIPIEQPPYRVPINVSQQVAPNDTDRFGIRVIIEDHNIARSNEALYIGEIKLIYDENDKELIHDVAFTSLFDGPVTRFFDCGQETDEMLKLDREIIRESINKDVSLSDDLRVLIHLLEK